MNGYGLETLGTSPTYGDVYGALKSGLERQQETTRRRLLQSIGVRNLRTSGIGMYPTQEAERQRAAQEASLMGTLGSARLRELFQAEQAEKDRAFRERMARWYADMQRQQENRQRLAAYQGILPSIFMGAATQGLGAGLTSWLTPKKSGADALLSYLFGGD